MRRIKKIIIITKKELRKKVKDFKEGEIYVLPGDDINTMKGFVKFQRELRYVLNKSKDFNIKIGGALTFEKDMEARQ